MLWIAFFALALEKDWDQVVPPAPPEASAAPPLVFDVDATLGAGLAGFTAAPWAQIQQPYADIDFSFRARRGWFSLGFEQALRAIPPDPTRLTNGPYAIPAGIDGSDLALTFRAAPEIAIAALALDLDFSAGAFAPISAYSRWTRSIVGGGGAVSARLSGHPLPALDLGVRVGIDGRKDLRLPPEPVPFRPVGNGPNVLASTVIGYVQAPIADPARVECRAAGIGTLMRSACEPTRDGQLAVGALLDGTWTQPRVRAGLAIAIAETYAAYLANPPTLGAPPTIQFFEQTWLGAAVSWWPLADVGVGASLLSAGPLYNIQGQLRGLWPSPETETHATIDLIVRLVEPTDR